MLFEMIVARYGLAAVCLGAGVEGETAAMAGCVMARQHFSGFPNVAVAAAVGSFVADQCFFSIGRHFRDRQFVQNFLDKPSAHRAFSLLDRHPNRFILSIRFLYGIRTLSPIAVGTSEITRIRFIALNAVAAILWAMLFTAIGYELGDEHKPLSGQLYLQWPKLLGALAVTVIGLALVRTACWHLHHRAGLRPTAPGNGTEGPVRTGREKING